MKIIFIVLNVVLIQAEYKSNNPWEFFRVGPEIIQSNQPKYSSRLHKSNNQSSYAKSAKYKSDDLDDVEYTFVSPNKPNVYNYDGQEGPSGSEVAGRSRPGYPSSDFVRYFARYTSLKGQPKAAPAAYRASRLTLAPYEYYPEPENSYSQFERLIDSEEKKNPLNSYRNFLFAGDNFISRAETGRLVSPTGQGPLNGFYYGPVSRGGALLIVNRPFYF